MVKFQKSAVEVLASGRIAMPALSSRPMSIIAALDVGDCLLLAADSMVTEEGGIRTTEQKLDVLDGRPIAWGFSGDEGIGFQFRDWMNAWTWPSEATWRIVADASIEELSRLNGRRRQLNKLAAVKTNGEDLATVLMAGYVGGVPDVFELTDRGNASSVKHTVFSAIGSGSAHAKISYFTLRNAAKDHKPDLEMLRFVVEIAARFAPKCGMPMRILRISPQGVEDIQR